MKIRVLKIGWIAMLVAAVQRLVTGVMFLFMEGHDLGASVLYLAMAVAILLVTLGHYQSGDQWSWWTLFVLGATPPVFCIIVHGPDLWPIIGLLFILPGLVIPLKAVFRKQRS